MKSIRKGCFETNSSSMHSLAIWKEVEPYENYALTLGGCDDEGIFKLFKYRNDVRDAQYDRYPFQQLISPIDKLRYVVGCYCGEGKWTSNKIRKELEAVVKAHVPGCKKVQFYYEDWDGNREYAYTSSCNDSGEFPIDFLHRKNISLEDFIFNPKYTLQIDGDEYQTFANMFRINMINIDNLEDISSGIDYWTENYTNFWVEQINLKSLEDGSTYLDQIEATIEGVDNVYINSQGAKEEDWKKVAEIVTVHRGKKNFYLDTLGEEEDKENAKKYLPDIPYKKQVY